MKIFEKACNFLKKIMSVASGSSTETRLSVPQHKGDEFEVQMWNVSRFVVKKLVPIVGVQPFPLTELCLMTATLCRLRPTHIFEWGTNIGASARVFYEVVLWLGLDTVINSVDLPDDHYHLEHPGKKRGLLVKHIEAVKLYQGDGLSTSLEIWNASKQRDSKPLFFLDGDHSYESVKRELDTLNENINEFSALVHDTFFQTEDACYNVGPHNAVKDFLLANEERFCCISTCLGLPGMTLLYPKK